MKTLLKSTRWLPLIGGTAAIAYLKQDSMAEALFGRSGQQAEDNLPTKTFIWGNGLYIPGGSMSFTNFEPKHIKNFDGVNGPSMR